MAVLGLEDLREQAGITFVVHPTDENSLTPLGFDLKIGQSFLLSQDGERQEVVPGDKIEGSQSGVFSFPARSTSLIVTRERVWLSGRLMGVIHARGSLALRGLIINSTTVDPNWDGKMLMRIHNTSEQTEFLEQHDAFCTLVLHETISATDVRPNTDPRNAVGRLDELYGTEVASALYSDLQLGTSKAEDERSSKKIAAAKEVLNRGDFKSKRMKSNEAARDLTSMLGIAATGSTTVSLILVYVLSNYPETFPVVAGAASLILLPLFLFFIIRKFSK